MNEKELKHQKLMAACEDAQLQHELRMQLGNFKESVATADVNWFVTFAEGEIRDIKKTYEQIRQLKEVRAMLTAIEKEV